MTREIIHSGGVTSGKPITIEARMGGRFIVSEERAASIVVEFNVPQGQSFTVTPGTADIRIERLDLDGQNAGTRLVNDTPGSTSA
jgi:hypothetical protein